MLRLSQTDLALSSDELKELKLLDDEASRSPVPETVTSPAPSTFSPPSISTHSQSLPTTPRFSDPIAHEGTPVSPPPVMSPTTPSLTKVSRKQKLRQSRRKKRTWHHDSSPLTRITHAAESCSADAISDVATAATSSAATSSSSSSSALSSKSGRGRSRRRIRYHKRLTDAVHKMVGSSSSMDSVSGGSGGSSGSIMSGLKSMTPSPERKEMKRHMSEPPKGRLTRGEKLRSRRRLRDRIVGISPGEESPAIKPQFMSPKSEGAALHRRGVGFAPPLMDDSEEEDDAMGMGTMSIGRMGRGRLNDEMDEDDELMERTDSMRRAKTVGGQTMLTLSESKSTPMKSVKIARVKFFSWNTDLYDAQMFDIKGFTAIGRAPMISSPSEDWSAGNMISCTPELRTGDTIRFKLTIPDSLSRSAISSGMSSSGIRSMSGGRSEMKDQFSIGLIRQVYVIADDETIIAAGTPASSKMAIGSFKEEDGADGDDCSSDVNTTPQVSSMVVDATSSSLSPRLGEYPVSSSPMSGARKGTTIEREIEPVISECWLNERGSILESIDQSSNMELSESRWSLPTGLKNGDVISVKIEDENETVIFAIEDPMFLHMNDDDDSDDEFDCWKIHKVDVDFPLPSSVGGSSGTGWMRTSTSASSIRGSDSFCKLQRIESVRFLALFKCFTPGIKLSIV